MASKLRALPDVQSIKDPNIRAAYEAIKENLEKILGLSGNVNEKYVSQEDVSRTIETVRSQIPKYVQGNGEPPILPIPTITADDIIVSGYYKWIMLTWDVAYDYWIAYYEIFRSEDEQLANAISVAKTLDHIWMDEDVNPGQSFYYWIRIVQKAEAGGNAGVLPTIGKMGTCPSDPSLLLDILEGYITESHLADELSTLIDGLASEWTIKIDANGRIAGIGLASEEGGTTAFAIRADKFYAVLPTGDGSTYIVPFVVGNINGIPSVGINGQLIVDGTILARMIAANQITADKLNVSNLAAISANLGNITAGSINIGNGTFVVSTEGQAYFGNCDLQSSNYQSGVTGWSLTRQGNLDLTNINCIGTANIKDLNVTTGKINDLAVTTGKINNLAVTTGKIADLAVSTLKIQNNACTVPNSAYTAGTFSTVYTGEYVLQTITFTATGQPVHINAGFSYDPLNPNEVYGSTFYIRRNGTEICRRLVYGVDRNEVLSISIPIGDTPPAGSVTYTLSGDNLDDGNVSQRSLLVLECKK